MAAETLERDMGVRIKARSRATSPTTSSSGASSSNPGWRTVATA